MASMTLSQGFASRLAEHDLVLAKTTSYVKRFAAADLGRVYRFRHLFKTPDVAAQQKQIEFFAGSSGGWGETPNYVDEVGFLFLNDSGKSISQVPWHGHIPIERHDDGELWCLLYQIKLWNYQDVPSVLIENYKPNMQRLNSQGQPVHTWVRFKALETYLMDLITELDQKPCIPLDVADIQPWLESVKHA